MPEVEIDTAGKNIIYSSLSALRGERCMTLEELSLKLKDEGVALSPEDIAKIESNERIVFDFELYHLSKVLNVKSSELINKDLSEEELAEAFNAGPNL